MSWSHPDLRFNSLRASDLLPKDVFTGHLFPSLQNSDFQSNLGFVEVIPPTNENIIALLRIFTNAEYPFQNTDVSSLGSYAGNVYRFLLALDAYKDSQFSLIPIEYILKNAHLPDFAVTLKRVKQKCLIRSVSGFLLEDPEWWDEVPSWAYHDPGSIFNYSYLPHFAEESTDFEDVSFLPVNQDEEILQLYRERARAILAVCDIHKISCADVLNELRSSSSLLPDHSTCPGWMQSDYDRSIFSSERKVGKRCLIQVGPAGARDGLILCPADVNTITLIERQTRDLLESNFDEFPARNYPAFAKHYAKLVKKFSAFYCRDLQKEGLSRPRNLTTILMEELQARFPDADAYRIGVSFFSSNPVLDYTGEIRHPTRGTGLGFANSLVALMQLVIHSLVMERMRVDSDQNREAGELPDIAFMTLNDDMEVFLNSLDHLFDYRDAEEEILTGLGLLRKDSKTFFSERGGVFLEIHHIDGEIRNTKEHFFRREALLPLCAQNITHAKTFNWNAFSESYFPLILQKWGYEFFPSEALYTRNFGGWRPHLISGVDLTMVLNDFTDAFPNAHVYDACRRRVRKITYPRGEEPDESPYFTALTREERAFIADYNIDSHLALRVCDIKELLAPLKYSRRLFFEYWDRLYQRRQSSFKAAPSGSLTLADALRHFLSSTRADIMSPPSLMGYFCDIGFGKSLPDIFYSPSPLSSYRQRVDNVFNSNLISSRFALTQITDSSSYTYRKKDQEGSSFRLISEAFEGIEKPSLFFLPEELRIQLLTPQSYAAIAFELDYVSIPPPLNLGKRKTLDLRNSELRWLRDCDILNLAVGLLEPDMLLLLNSLPSIEEGQECCDIWIDLRMEKLARVTDLPAPSDEPEDEELIAEVTALKERIANGFYSEKSRPTVHLAPKTYIEEEIVWIPHSKVPVVFEPLTEVPLTIEFDASLQDLWDLNAPNKILSRQSVIFDDKEIPWSALSDTWFEVLVRDRSDFHRGENPPDEASYVSALTAMMNSFVSWEPYNYTTRLLIAACEWVKLRSEQLSSDLRGSTFDPLGPSKSSERYQVKESDLLLLLEKYDGPPDDDAPFEIEFDW